MKFDTRNPFAAWGFEQEVYTTDGADETIKLDETNQGFVPASSVSDTKAYVNNAADITMSDSDWADQNAYDGSNFDSNDERMKPSAHIVKRAIYGEDSLTQQEDDLYNNKELNYYGIQYNDLYGEKKKSVIPEDYKIVNNPEDIPTENTEEVKVALVGDETANALNSNNYYKELMVTEANVSSTVNYNAVDKLTIDGITVSGDKGSKNGKITYAASEVVINDVVVDENTETTVYNMFEGTQSTNENYDGLDKLDATNIKIDNPGLTHNVINIYTPADGAVINIKDSDFNLNVNNTNVARFSNYLNAQNVVVNFENVNWTYETGSPDGADWRWAGLAIYQPAGADTALNGDYSAISTWTFNVKNCKYNGVKVDANNFGEHNQVIYAYNVNNSGNVTDPTEIGVAINFE